MSLNDFEIIKELGKGSFGIVYLIKRKIDNSLYALTALERRIIKKKYGSRFQGTYSHLFA